MKTVRTRRFTQGTLVVFSIIFALLLDRATAHEPYGDDDYTWLKSAHVDCILISIADQRMDVFGNHELIAWSTISSGRTGFDTPTGQFIVTDKDLMHRSNLYHNAPMPFFLRLTDGGVGMHAGELPGYPASHGCIRLPYDMARHLYQSVDAGTFVQIIPGPIASVFDPTPHKAATGVVAND